MNKAAAEEAYLQPGSAAFRLIFNLPLQRAVLWQGGLSPAIGMKGLSLPFFLVFVAPEKPHITPINQNDVFLEFAFLLN